MSERGTEQKLQQCHHCDGELQVRCEKRISPVAVYRSYEHAGDADCPLKAIHETVSPDRTVEPGGERSGEADSR